MVAVVRDVSEAWATFYVVFTHATTINCALSDYLSGFVLRRLTAVGYGRRFPITTEGRGVAMITGLIGTFYMAMPLSILGIRFYDIYGRLEELVNKKKYKLKKFVMLTRAFVIKKSKRSSKSIDEPSDQSRHTLFDQYKGEIEAFCNSKTLHSIDTVSIASVAEVKVL